MNRWDQDREEILQHWNHLGFVWKIILLFFTRKKLESVVYILNRLYLRPDSMVKTGEMRWDNIHNFLGKKL